MQRKEKDNEDAHEEKKKKTWKRDIEKKSKLSMSERITKDGGGYTPYILAIFGWRNFKLSLLNVLESV